MRCKDTNFSRYGKIFLQERKKQRQIPLSEKGNDIFFTEWDLLCIFAIGFYDRMEIQNLMTFRNRKALRRWLEENHQSARECWVASYRSKQPLPDALPYLDVVEEALCFGWIDSTVKKMEDGRLAQRISPRRKNSHWTERNIQRCKELERRGLMTDAGREAIPKQQ